MEKEKYIAWREKKQCYQITIKTKGKIFTRTAKTLEKAKQIRSLLIEQMDIVGILTFAQAWENWITKNVGRRGLAPSSLYKYLQCYRLIKPIVGNIEIEKINANDWQEIFLTLQEDRDLSFKYINTHKNRVFAMYNYYMQRGYDIKINPLLDTVLKQTDTNRKAAFTDGEKEKFLKAAKRYEYKWYLLFKLLFETGCRRGEVLALQWQDIDFYNKVIHIRHSISKGIVDGEYMEFCGKTKTPQSRRDIPLSDKMAFLLRMIYNQKKPLTDDFVFTAGDYCHWCKYPFVSLSRITEVFAYLRKITNINKGLTVHSIRHYVTTQLVHAGIDLATIMAIGGWSSSKMILEVYAHSNQQNKRDALAKLC